MSAFEPSRNVSSFVVSGEPIVWSMAAGWIWAMAGMRPSALGGARGWLGLGGVGAEPSPLAATDARP
jgi:hypothetical protein